MAEGAWIFLSHSHMDFDKVRDVRNTLELQGHHPLMFFLKCLSDDDEVDDLIRREIESRSWFILCDSQNARKSQWVKAEIRIIRSLPIKTVTMIDLDDPHLDVEAALFSLTQKASIFLSYSRKDKAFADRIRKELLRHDFGVFSDLELQPGENWVARIETELHKAAQRGAIIILLSSHSVRSQWLQKEVALAAEISSAEHGHSNIFSLYLESDIVIRKYAPPNMQRCLKTIQGIDFSKGRFEDNMTNLMTRLREFKWIF